MKDWMIYSMGFLAQILFSSRLILQWIISEKNKKILTPTLFWELSLLASFLLFVYGYCRDDFAIMLGQVITYYIYIRNLQLQQEWKKFHVILRYFIVFFPVIVMIYGYNNNIYDLDNLLRNQHIPLWLLLLGIFSQLLFTLRFVYQWIYSERRKQSSLPLGFWIISFCGSLLILVYAVIRKDPVLFIGHIVGIVIYARSIMIALKK
ncbi:lipid-A-disaccharide synthase N-terminal domain-containing protein [Terrimonas rubra]|uniref:Lipid-A-disaccharide synthase N-terminal domain-containing protein n=1 Tax=Terrimonas rubra TaxID=1035890 RepID=A0ABW6ACD8_9BACT